MIPIYWVVLYISYFLCKADIPHIWSVSRMYQPNSVFVFPVAAAPGEGYLAWGKGGVDLSSSPHTVCARFLHCSFHNYNHNHWFMTNKGSFCKNVSFYLNFMIFFCIFVWYICIYMCHRQSTMSWQSTLWLNTIWQSTLWLEY